MTFLPLRRGTVVARANAIGVVWSHDPVEGLIVLPVERRPDATRAGDVPLVEWPDDAWTFRALDSAVIRAGRQRRVHSVGQAVLGEISAALMMRLAHVLDRLERDRVTVLKYATWKASAPEWRTPKGCI